MQGTTLNLTELNVFPFLLDKLHLADGFLIKLDRLTLCLEKTENGDVQFAILDTCGMTQVFIVLNAQRDVFLVIKMVV